MAIFIKQWGDGDFSLVVANDAQAAARMLAPKDNIDPDTLLQLKAPDPIIHFSLDDAGQLITVDLTPAMEEARRACYPALMQVLDGAQFTGDERRTAIAAAVQDEVWTDRKVSKLSARLLAQKKRQGK
jgi:hypothetical protein